MLALSMLEETAAIAAFKRALGATRFFKLTND